MTAINTHPLYPERYDINTNDYEEKCPYFESPSLKMNENTWADPENISLEELHTRGIWEWRDDKAKIISLKEAGIKFKDGKPITPIKTGIKGRGMLGKFGPNHAADSIVTKWMNDELYFVAVQRKDTGEWAIPGGMVDPGENGIETVRREFTEEACQDCDSSILDEVFRKENSEIIYAGPTYEDPRTTDSAWIETLVAHYHINQRLADKITLTPQKSEVKNVKWISCNEEKLYGGHKQFIDMVKEKMEHVKTEEILRAKINNENENFEDYYKVASVFAYISIVIMIIYYVLQINNAIKTTEEYIFNSREECILNNTEECILTSICNYDCTF